MALENQQPENLIVIYNNIDQVESNKASKYELPEGFYRTFQFRILQNVSSTYRNLCNGHI